MRPWRVLALVGLSAPLAIALELVGVPAGLLIGPMAAAIVLAGLGKGFALPGWLSAAGQAIVGLLIATSFGPDLLGTVASQPLLFLGVTLATIAISVVIGIVLTRWHILPGTTALWGSMPGAATAMTLMARDFDADERLVATMTFSRVACVATLASVIALVLGGGGGSGGGLASPGAGWLPALDPLPFATAIGVAVVGAVVGRRIGLPAGALLGPMILGGALAFAGSLHVQLPGWLLACAYTLVGWRIGLAFTPEVLRDARRAAPGILASIATLIGFGACLGFLLAYTTGRDLLTCYLATSPGGADSVAIIASDSSVDVPFVMAMQVLRFLAVLIAGPVLARFIARRL